MIRNAFTTSCTSLWFPVASIITVALLAANSARISSVMYWSLTSVVLIALGVWKLNVRLRISREQLSQPTAGQIELLRPYGYAFLVVYFFLAIALLGYVAVEWYYQLDNSWMIFITLISAWAIRYEIWATIVGDALINIRLPK